MTTVGNGRLVIATETMDTLLEFDSDGIAMAEEIVKLRHSLANKMQVVDLDIGTMNKQAQTIAELKRTIEALTDEWRGCEQ